ncbi:MAG: NAD(P)/FAD-dependent oxidoreductase [Bacteroidaceae bacterium]|nr:NAD(P)/FAD-dependent oxidoreductase [Bacteroidaceae bacterium]
MPVQTAPSRDEILIGESVNDFAAVGADPERVDRVMLRRRRVSRIFFSHRFFDYPISLKFSTLSNLGLLRTIRAFLSYMRARIMPRKEQSLEDFYINRFGKMLYSLFFETYTQKLWGKHPSEIEPDWGSQRVKGLSVARVIKNAIRRLFPRVDVSQKGVETSLIENFLYPKYGPGQLWEIVAREIIEGGGELRLNNRVVRVNVEGGRAASVDVVSPDGVQERLKCDYLFSTMPLAQLIPSLQGILVPDAVLDVARGLPFRDFITVGLLLDSVKIKNETKLRTFANRPPDTWIYIQERDVKVGRVQIFNNWSPYMVADYENTMFIGLEYFCSEGDDLWQMSDEQLSAMAVDELVGMDIVERSAMLDSVCVRMKKAYPAYFGTYDRLDEVRHFIDSIDNIYCLGRNGQHRYNNMDHSMLTAMVAVDNIINDVSDKSNIWSVNTESDYHEE